MVAMRLPIPDYVVPRPRSERKVSPKRSLQERQLSARWRDFAAQFHPPQMPCLWCRAGQATRAQSSYIKKSVAAHIPFEVVRDETDYDYCFGCRRQVTRHHWGLWGRAEICGKCGQAISLGRDSDGVAFKVLHFLEGCGSDANDGAVTYLPADYDCPDQVQMLSPFRERLIDNEAPARYRLGPWYIVQNGYERVTRERLKFVGGTAALEKAERQAQSRGRASKKRTW